MRDDEVEHCQLELASVRDLLTIQNYLCISGEAIVSLYNATLPIAAHCLDKQPSSNIIFCHTENRQQKHKQTRR